jgi:hypothetical protein
MEVDFKFDESVRPLTIELHLNGCSVVTEDAVYLVPAKITLKEVHNNIDNLILLNLSPDPVYKNKGRAMLEKRVVGRYYLIYARYNRIVEFTVLGTSRYFDLRSNTIVMRKSISSDRSLEEWTKNLLRSTRIEDENEQELIIKLFENSQCDVFPESEVDELPFNRMLRGMINIHKRKSCIKKSSSSKGSN